MNILLTGVTGMIGRSLYPLLCEKGYHVRCVLRQKGDPPPVNEDVFFYENLDENIDWSEALNQIDTVIHLAAQVPTSNRKKDILFKTFFHVNFKGTKRLAEQAAQKKVKRFIFISTIGVFSTSDSIIPLSENDRENPNNNYALSKQMAEHSLRLIGNQTGMEMVILRPPLVYGPFVKANFLKLLDCVYMGIPLPFAGVKNQRNFIALENLTQAVLACVAYKKEINEIFIISDEEYLSTKELILKISNAMGKPLRVFNFPAIIAKFLLTIIGKKSLYDKLWGSLRVESEKIKHQLNWVPKINIDEGIQKTVNWYLREKKS